MIHTVWPYLAVMLLAAGLFPALERRTGWRVFNVLPPIVFMIAANAALLGGRDPRALLAQVMPSMPWRPALMCRSATGRRAPARR